MLEASQWFIYRSCKIGMTITDEVSTDLHLNIGS